MSRFSFKSSLRRFSTRRQEAMGDRLISGGVLVDETDSVKWSVQLYPNGFNTACSDHLSLFAAFQSNNKSLTLSKRVEFSIIDARGQKRNRVSFEDTFSPNFGRGFGKFVSRKRLRSQADQLLPNDTLTICCQVPTHSLRLGSRQRYPSITLLPDGLYGLNMIKILNILP